MKNSASLRSTRLVDHLVHLSGQRRRDDLLVDITRALAETIDAQRVEICSLVHDEGKRFWLALTRAEVGAPARILSDPMRTESHMMTPLEDEPERTRCLDRVERVTSAPNAARPHFLNRFPMMLSEGATAWGVAEIYSLTALSEADAAAVNRLLSMYGNMLDMLDYSECDALTGLWNRKPFDDLFYKTLRPTEPVEPTESPPVPVEQRVTVSPSNFWLAMVDIDHFKQVNDTYGHPGGDAVIRHLGQLLLSGAREGDVVCRYGGEEFVVALPHMDLAAAMVRAEAWRCGAEAQTVAHGELAIRYTLSAGVAGFPTHAGEFDALLECADRALYRSKQGGRNRVTPFAIEANPC